MCVVSGVHARRSSRGSVYAGLRRQLQWVDVFETPEAPVTAPSPEPCLGLTPVSVFERCMDAVARLPHQDISLVDETLVLR